MNARAAIAAIVGVLGIAASVCGQATPTTVADLLPAPPAEHARMDVWRPSATAPDDVLPSGAVTRMGGATFRPATGSMLSDVSADMKLLICQGNQARIVQLPDWKPLLTLTLPQRVNLRGRITEDGKTVALWTEHAIHVCDAATGKYLHYRPIGTGVINEVALSKDGKLMIAGVGVHVLVWRLTDGKMAAFLRGENACDALAFSVDSKRIITAWPDGNVRIWPMPGAGPAGGEPTVFKAGSKVAGRLSMGVKPSPDGSKLAVASYFKEEDDIPLSEVQVFDLAGNNKLLCSVWFGSKFGFTPDGKTVVTVGYDRIHVHDAETGKKIREIRKGSDNYAGLVAPDGVTVLEHDSQVVRLWDTREGKILREPVGHTSEVTFLTFSADGHRLASASSDYSVRIWDADKGKQLHVLTGHPRGPLVARFLSDSKTLRTANGGILAECRTWDVATGSQQAKTLKCPMSDDVVFSPDGGKIAILEGNELVTIHDLAADKTVATISKRKGAYWCAVFSDDGKLFAGGDRSGSDFEGVHLWDAQKGERIRVFTADKDVREYCAVALSPNGKHLAGGTWDNLFIWEVQTGKLVHHIKLKFNIYGRLAFSPDSNYLATQGGFLWDVRTGQKAAVLPDGQTYTAFAFNPAGTRLATGHADGTILIWDVKRLLSESAPSAKPPSAGN